MESIDNQAVSINTNWAKARRSNLYRLLRIWVLCLGCQIVCQSWTCGQFANNCVPRHRMYAPQQYLQIACSKHTHLMPGDEIWWVTSRNVQGQLASPDQLVTLQYIDGNWVERSASSLIYAHQATGDKLTIFYAHGNRTDPHWSIVRGLEVYCNLFAANVRSPIRFVIWHWPADQYKLPVQEFEDNARRAIIHGRHFARFLLEIDPQQPTCLMGYSLGSQFMLSACEQMSKFAEQNCGNALLWQASHVRLTSVASVTACQWPENQLQTQRVATMIDRALVIENREDKALKAFQLKCRIENKHCMCGPLSFQPLSCHGTEVQHFDASRILGSEHSVSRYVSPPAIQAVILSHLALIP